MSRSERRTRCKQCGKVIMGRSKMGLCDRCFNKDATGTMGLLGGFIVGMKYIYRPLINWFKNRKK